MTYDFLGYIGSCFYSICYIPQIYFMWQNKKDSINIFYILCQLMGASCLLSYGIINKLLPIIIGNLIPLFCNFIITYRLYHPPPLLRDISENNM